MFTHGTFALASGLDEPGNGVTPMETLATALAACTAMDVASILVKMRQPLKAFSVEVSGERLVTHVFECTMPGYRGWSWVVVLTRASRAKVVVTSGNHDSAQRLGKNDLRFMDLHHLGSELAPAGFDLVAFSCQLVERGAGDIEFDLGFFGQFQFQRGFEVLVRREHDELPVLDAADPPGDLKRLRPWRRGFAGAAVFTRFGLRALARRERPGSPWKRAEDASLVGSEDLQSGDLFVHPARMLVDMGVERDVLARREEFRGRRPHDVDLAVGQELEQPRLAAVGGDLHLPRRHCFDGSEGRNRRKIRLLRHPLPPAALLPIAVLRTLRKLRPRDLGARPD